MDADGVHLLEGSPCINAGDPGGDYTGKTDIDGQDRVQHCRVDMGVDETEHIGSDCNENGVPDACDVDPADPDGNGEVSEDCNANGVPDECETLPATIYVNDSATDGSNDGSSWIDAFVELHDALDFAECSVAVTDIWVAQGTYKPGTERTDTFQLLLIPE